MRARRRLNPRRAGAVKPGVEPRPRLIGVLVAAAVLAGAVTALVLGGGGGRSVAADPAALAWLHPNRPGRDWSTLRLPGSPASLPVPPGWHAADGDPGTQTAELTTADGTIEGYLNATPREGEETPANWADFRVDHNREEGDRDVTLLAAATGVKFGGATGSCVVDSYVTSSAHTYREVACLVTGPSAATVVVAAAPPGRWHTAGGQLRRAIESFTT